MFKSALVLTAALLVTVAETRPAAAQDPAFWECSIAQSQNGRGWIAPQIVFAMQGNTVAVMDGIIHNRNSSKPLPAEVVEHTDKKLVLRWQMALSNRGEQTIMRYRAALFLQTGKVTVDARPAGYDDKLQERGTCQQLAAKPGKKRKG